jgi:hypothetical protein
LFTSLQIKFLIFIAIVAVITLGFAILIGRQIVVVGKKAVEAKQHKQEYLDQLRVEQPKEQQQEESNE